MARAGCSHSHRCRRARELADDSACLDLLATVGRGATASRFPRLGQVNERHPRLLSRRPNHAFRKGPAGPALIEDLRYLMRIKQRLLYVQRLADMGLATPRVFEPWLEAIDRLPIDRTT